VAGTEFGTVIQRVAKAGGNRKRDLMIDRREFVTQFAALEKKPSITGDLILFWG